MNVSSGWSGNPIRRNSRPHQILQCPIKLSLDRWGTRGLGNILTDIPEFQTGRIGNSKPAELWGAQRSEEMDLNLIGRRGWRRGQRHFAHPQWRLVANQPQNKPHNYYQEGSRPQPKEQLSVTGLVEDCGMIEGGCQETDGTFSADWSENVGGFGIEGDVEDFPCHARLVEFLPTWSKLQKDKV